MAMPSVQDLFYNANEEPVMVVGNTSDRARQGRRGYLSRQDSRNFRSSASPPPSRSNHHASSWFGHRKSSQSPPRHGRYQSEYSDYRRDKYGRSPERRSSWFGRKSSRSPSRYHEYSQSHTKYKEDYTGYPAETGYTAQDGYGSYGSRNAYGYGRPEYSSDLYHGEQRDVIPRTYQSPYAGAFNKDYLETVKLHVPLCCEACEERITNHMLALEGVESVTCDQVKQKVTVRGTASPSEVLRQGRECFKHTRFW
jgi:copper chaperone CopZ